MKKTLILLSLIVLLVLAGFTAANAFRAEKAVAAPEVYASGLSGGCYITAPNVCKLHADYFTINVNDGGGFKLVEFLLQANGSTIYAFKTDALTDYRPVWDYTPSLVMQDFAATCGKTYTLNLIARDEGDATLYNVATTAPFTCPTNVP